MGIVMRKGHVYDPHKVKLVSKSWKLCECCGLGFSIGNKAYMMIPVDTDNEVQRANRTKFVHAGCVSRFGSAI